MEQALEFLDGSFAWTMKATAYASIVIVLVLAVQWMIGQRLSARWRYALWLLVIVRALSPVLPASAWSLFNFAPSADASSRPDEANISLIAPTRIVVETGVVEGPTKVAIAPAEESRPLNWLAITWIGGSVISCLFSRISAVLLGRRIRRATLVRKPEVIRLLDDCSRLLGLRRAPDIVILPEIPGPALAGVWHPRILMPTGLIESLDERELRFVLLHELAHLKRRDLLVEWLLVLMRAVHWFNPLVWYAVARCRADRELACDEHVLAPSSNSSSGDYGRTILKLSQMLSIDRPSLVGAVRILESKSALKRRIHMIAKFNAGRRHASTVIAAMTLLVLASCTLTDRKSQPATQASAPHVHQKSAAVSNTIDMRIFHVEKLAASQSQPAAPGSSRLDQLAQSVRDLLAPSVAAAGEGATKPTVDVDARTNSLMVTANSADMEHVAKLLGELHAGSLQVQVMAHFIAVDEAGLAALSHDVPEAFAGDAIPAAVGKTLVAAATARAKNDKSSVAIVAAPKLLMHEGQKASFLVGDDTPYVGALVQGNDSSGKETYEPRIDYAVTGLSLDVTAKTDGSRVVLDIHSAMRKVVAVRDKPFGKSMAGENLAIQVPETIGSEVTTTATLDEQQCVLVRGVRGAPAWITPAAMDDRGAREPEKYVLLLLHAAIIGNEAANAPQITPPAAERLPRRAKPATL